MFYQEGEYVNLRKTDVAEVALRPAAELERLRYVIGTAANLRELSVPLWTMLVNVEEVQLRSNGLRDLAPLARLPRLVRMDVSLNPVEFPPLVVYTGHDCVDPGGAVFDSLEKCCVRCMKQYVVAARHDTTADFEQSLLVLGNGGVGKTTLLNALLCYDGSSISLRRFVRFLQDRRSCVNSWSAYQLRYWIAETELKRLGEVRLQVAHLVDTAKYHEFLDFVEKLPSASELRLLWDALHSSALTSVNGRRFFAADFSIDETFSGVNASTLLVLREARRLLGVACEADLDRLGYAASPLTALQFVPHIFTEFVEIHDNRIGQFRCWDFAGQLEYFPVNSIFDIGTRSVFVLVCTARSTVESPSLWNQLVRWLKLVQSQLPFAYGQSVERKLDVSKSKSPYITVILVLTHCDHVARHICDNSASAMLKVCAEFEPELGVADGKVFQIRYTDERSVRDLYACIERLQAARIADELHCALAALSPDRLQRMRQTATVVHTLPAESAALGEMLVEQQRADLRALVAPTMSQSSSPKIRKAFELLQDPFELEAELRLLEKALLLPKVVANANVIIDRFLDERLYQAAPVVILDAADIERLLRDSMPPNTTDELTQMIVYALSLNGKGSTFLARDQPDGPIRQFVALDVARWLRSIIGEIFHPQKSAILGPLLSVDKLHEHLTLASLRITKHQTVMLLRFLSFKRLCWKRGDSSDWYLPMLQRTSLSAARIAQIVNRSRIVGRRIVCADPNQLISYDLFAHIHRLLHYEARFEFSPPGYPLDEVFFTLPVDQAFSDGIVLNVAIHAPDLPSVAVAVKRAPSDIYPHEFYQQSSVDVFAVVGDATNADVAKALSLVLQFLIVCAGLPSALIQHPLCPRCAPYHFCQQVERRCVMSPTPPRRSWFHRRDYVPWMVDESDCLDGGAALVHCSLVDAVVPAHELLCLGAPRVGAPVSVPNSAARDVSSDEIRMQLDDGVRRKSHVDLHAHLLGMGNATFWIDQIIAHDIDDLVRACTFSRVSREFSATAVHFSVPPANNYNWLEQWRTVVSASHRAKLEIPREHIDTFTCDVVYSIHYWVQAFDSKSSGLPLFPSQPCATSTRAEFEPILNWLEKRVGQYRFESELFTSSFRLYSVFNARAQRVEWRFGITNVDLRRVLTGDGSDLFRKRLSEAFEMPLSHAQERFWEKFTPEFYPRRYALKDAIYEQYPDVLDILLDHVLARYWRAGVSHVEFSVGIGDVLRPWIWHHFARPRLRSADARNMRFFFLAGIGRHCQQIRLGSVAEARAKLAKLRPLDATTAIGRQVDDGIGSDIHIVEAVHDLNDAQTMQLFLNDTQTLQRVPVGEIDKLTQLASVLVQCRRDVESNEFPLEKLVGLDYFGDEHLRPFCPFYCAPFVDLLRAERSARRGMFGFRIHCGEWTVANPTALSDVQRAHLVAISSVVVKFFTAWNGGDAFGDRPVLRIGHGLAFQYAFTDSICRDDAIVTRAIDLLRHNAVALEVNMTSNETLLGFNQNALQTMLSHKLNAIIATDNDGIWQCKHANFSSVPAEYARALQYRVFDINEMINAAQRACFVPFMPPNEAPNAVGHNDNDDGGGGGSGHGRHGGRSNSAREIGQKRSRRDDGDPHDDINGQKRKRRNDYPTDEAPVSSTSSDLQQQSIPVGLPNLGSSCWLNALMQCFIASPWFRDALLTLTQQQYAGLGDAQLIASLGILTALTDSRSAVSLQTMQAIGNAIGAAWVHARPSDAVSGASWSYRQLDIVDGFQAVICGLATSGQSAQARWRGLSSDLGGLFQFEQSQRDGSNALANTCGTLHVTSMSCNVCSTVARSTAVLEHVVAISMTNDDLRAHPPLQLMDILHERALNTHQMVDREAVDCPSCGDRTATTVSVRLSSAPSALIIHLRRFTGALQQATRIDAHITIPFQLQLDNRAVLCPGDSSLYQLDAAAIHAGGGDNSGHYYAIVRHGECWYKMDDTVVTVLSPSEALHALEMSYLLFYSRTLN